MLALTAAVHITIFLIGGFLLLQLNGESDAAKAEKEKTELETAAVDFIRVQTGNQKQKINIQGRVRAENRLEIFPEVQGRVLSAAKAFREGVTFSKGETMLQLDNQEARLQLYASRSGFQTLIASLLPDLKLDYSEKLDVFEEWYNSIQPEHNLPDIPDFDHPQLKSFLTSRGVYNKFYQIKSAENKLGKFTIKAPFTGVLSAANTEPGQTVGPQAHLGTLVDPKSYLLTAPIRRSQLNSVQVGDEVELMNKISKWPAKVMRINPSVDPQTQSVEIYLEISGEDLMEGIYLEGVLETGETETVAEIPKSALLRNGYVYALRDGTVQLVSVQVVDVGRTTIWVTGLTESEEIAKDAAQSIGGHIIMQEAGYERVD